MKKANLYHKRYTYKQWPIYKSIKFLYELNNVIYRFFVLGNFILLKITIL